MVVAPALVPVIEYSKMPTDSSPTPSAGSSQKDRPPSPWLKLPVKLKLPVVPEMYVTEPAGTAVRVRPPSSDQ